VNVRQLPNSVMGVLRIDGRIQPVEVPIKDELGELLTTAIPKVSLFKGAGQYSGDAPAGEMHRWQASWVKAWRRMACSANPSEAPNFIRQAFVVASPYLDTGSPLNTARRSAASRRRWTRTIQPRPNLPRPRLA
jgi:hypothetical protein